NRRRRCGASSWLVTKTTQEDDRKDGEVVIMGDFNEVRDISERFGSIFNKHGAEAFNSFTVNAGLVEVPLGEGSVADGHRRREVVRLIQEVEKVDAIEVAQKAKIRWSIEGDENSKYYHGVLNKKRGRLTIRGVLVDAPGPDGFTFGFYRRYWDIIGSDVIDAVKWFFLLREISKGGNSSFIYLIHKVPNANMVKDFRPISLIGSLYKVIAKVLENRLLTVLDDIVDEIQPTFCQWSQCNIDTIIRVLDVFYRASGLRINMNKSNLLGIFVDSNKVKHAAVKIGMHTRLSKWKLKTLSIGGRLTLFKSILGAIPIYHMSIFKVPMKKPSWVRWKSVLAAKDVGGLGVSNLFALNQALMFKWVWRFFSQKNLLWVRVVKALHGEDEKIGKKVQPRVNTSFWDVAWCGDIAFKNLVPRLYALESMKNIEVASKLSHKGLEFSFRRNPRGGVEQAQFERLKELVECVTLSNSNDRWSWSLVGSGDFLVSSVMKLIDNAILPKGILKTRWNKEPRGDVSCFSPPPPQ
nr:RNA-directed DNA polymerase, eukaryota, reverse transcriptase zinc-binding domain protein [Tanacetum cinerariifolium]